MATSEDAYMYYINTYPAYSNPELDETKESREMLITCECGAKYRIFANGNTPIVPISDSIKCKNCGRLANDQTISGHSAGIFNATARRV